jgi:hypothetical protein
MNIIWIKNVKLISPLSIFFHVPTRSRYRELGLELTKRSKNPPTMNKIKKEEEEGYRIAP